MLFHNLRLLIVGFGFGVILSGTVALWDEIPLAYRILFLAILTTTLYFGLLFVTSHGKHSDNKKDNSDAHPNKVTLR